jgi:hypothetical protein
MGKANGLGVIELPAGWVKRSVPVSNVSFATQAQTGVFTLSRVNIGITLHINLSYLT